MKRLAPVALVALVAGLLVVPSTARAQGGVRIMAGGFLGGPNCDPQTGEGCTTPADGMRFFGGPSIAVASGDTVTFELNGFHTATLIPKNTDVSDWVSKNAGGVGRPFSLLAPDPDDTAIDEGGGAETPSLKANLAAGFPSSFLCGTEAQPCPHDGSAVTNSGLPLGAGDGPPTFSATITGDPGDTVWVVCLVHTHMRFKITVTDGAATTQDAIDAAAATQLDLDNDEAAALHTQLLKKQTSHTTKAGKKVYDVQVGVDNHWFSLLGMYPKVSSIPKGATVRFHFAQSGIYEIHTATFPFEQALGVFDQTFAPGCDPDGDAGPGPDGPPENEATICNDPTQVEFDIPPMAAYVQGDGRFGGNDYENSGILGADAQSVAPWDLKFTKNSTKKGYRYFCLIHSPFMGGRIKVGR